jgi:hypothetical protein
VAEGSREVTAVATHFGFLSLLERTLRPVVTGLEWPGDGRLVLRGDYGGQQDRPAALVLRHVESGRQYTLPLRWEGGTFTTGFAPSTATGLGDPMPLAAGDWLVLAPAGTGGAEVAWHWTGGCSPASPATTGWARTRWRPGPTTPTPCDCMHASPAPIRHRRTAGYALFRCGWRMLTR